MRDLRTAKRAALGYLAQGRWADLRTLTSYPDRRHLLRWLDEAGLALYLLDRCEREAHTRELPCDWFAALHARRERNRTRLHVMQLDFRAVVRALTDSQVSFVIVKGFSLQPEFCSSIELRHHIDTDVVVRPADVARAVKALTDLGYVIEGREDFGEVRLVKGRLKAPPTSRDDIYSVRTEARVEVHNRLFESRSYTPFDLEDDWQASIRYKQLGTISFPTVSIADAFLLHVLHAFQHLAGGWVRLSWLYEISHFIELQKTNNELWRSILDRIANHEHCSHVFGLTLQQVSTIFGRDLPEVMASRAVHSLPAHLLDWNKNYVFPVALSDFGSQSRLFQLIEGHFFRNSRDRRSFIRSRWTTRLKSLVAYTARPRLLFSRVSCQLDAWAHLLVWRIRYACASLQPARLVKRKFGGTLWYTNQPASPNGGTDGQRSRSRR